MDNDAAAAAFVIPAVTSLQEGRPRILKQGDTFAVFDQNGDALATPGSTHGIYHHDTRYLSHLYLTINAARPILLSATLRDDNSILTCDLANPDLFDASGKLLVAHDLIHIRRSRFLWQGTSYERISIRNFDTVPLKFRLGLSFAADFADLFEVRAVPRRSHMARLP
jgi:glycogen debranching enzyme